VLKTNLKALCWSCLIAIIDQVTKLLIKHYLELNDVIHLVGRYIGFRYIENPGMAFGIQIGGKLFFTVFAVIASLVILIFLLRLPGNNFWTRFALASILGGAIGNLIDRIAFGRVVDFIEIGPWPIFNFADIAVTVGMIILIVIVFYERKEEKESQEEKFEINY
jgi:signal peptidase II